ncbi:MFS transporter [Microvirga sp. W0021]|uniref:MFS transporter n=1 Tax=Hohaiivirga grylli TaxID=3133970 RepID=A0ABV0BGM3_9HYPH
MYEKKQIDWNAWLVVAICFLTLAIASSTRGSLSLVMPAMESQFGWTRGFISTSASWALLVMAVTAPCVGNAVDKYGPRFLICFGLVALTIACFGIASLQSASQEWLFISTYAVSGGIAFGVIAQHVIAATIAMKFVVNRGLATGIGASGSTAGQLLLLPMFAILLQTGDWQYGYIVIGIISICLIPLTLWLLRPQTQKVIRNSVVIEKASGNSNHSSEQSISDGTLGAKLKRVLLSIPFQILFWTYFVCGFTTAGVIETHLMPYAALCGFPPLPRTSAYVLLSGFNLCGMILAGWLTDRVNRSLLLATIYFMRGLSFILLLYIGDSYPLLLIFAVMFGLFDYSTVPVTASLLASKLGIGVLGLSMGLLQTGHAVGAALGAYMGGVLFDHTGQYGMLWFTAVCLSIGAAFLAACLVDDRAKKMPGAVMA